jgi:drug/metabolite transporter (DMT)-like permease
VPGGLHTSGADQTGVLLAVISAVAYSFYLLGSARLVRGTGARPATAWGLSIGSLPLPSYSVNRMPNRDSMNSDRSA